MKIKDSERAKVVTIARSVSQSFMKFASTSARWLDDAPSKATYTRNLNKPDLIVGTMVFVVVRSVIKILKLRKMMLVHAFAIYLVFPTSPRCPTRTAITVPSVNLQLS